MNPAAPPLPNVNFGPWQRTLQRIFPLGDVREHNCVEIYVEGDPAFRDMLDQVKKATGRVWLETYIYAADTIGIAMREALIQAARRGCDVRVLVDGVGSHDLPEDFFSGLVSAGGRFAIYHPVGQRELSELVRRDHRKILVVDHVAFMGGMNISSDYAGPKLGNSRFRDTHARVEGPASDALADVFLHAWTEVTNDEPIRELMIHPPPEGNVQVQVIQSSGRRGRRKIQRLLHHVIRRSLRRCYVTSPYFVPPQRLVTALIVAARRNVDVRVLTAGVSDVPVAKLAGQHVYAKLLKKGVRIYEYNARALHAKSIAVDGVFGSLGSFNLDFWSHRRNLEVNISFTDAQLVEQLTEQFRLDLKEAKEIDLSAWSKRGPVKRAMEYSAYQLMRL